MPNGIHQVVGETGWQLSHGERSRVFLARALLQQADVLILDESFAALDPETLKICLRVLLKQQRTVILIAHP
jgi:ATP-binding cassette subfamily B protein